MGLLLNYLTLFNFPKIIGALELGFAECLEKCEDIIAYVKNYLAVGFRLDYINAHSDFSNYFPDFLVKKSPGEIYIVETKGREALDVPKKMLRNYQRSALENTVRIVLI